MSQICAWKEFGSERMCGNPSGNRIGEWCPLHPFAQTIDDESLVKRASHQATSAPLTERVEHVDRSEHVALYPCADCGIRRTKAQGGSVFSVCEACWAKRYHQPVSDADLFAQLPTQEDLPEDAARILREHMWQLYDDPVAAPAAPVVELRAALNRYLAARAEQDHLLVKAITVAVLQLTSEK